MTIQESLNHLLNLAIKGEPSYHNGYAWAEEYSEELKAYFGGVNLKKYTKRFARRESEDLFKQSLEITAPIQASLGSMLETPFAKVERSNYIKEVTLPGDEKGEKAKKFETEFLNKFGTKGLFPYTFERLRYWNIYDPNCFVVVEFKDFDNAKTNAKTYPFEVTSEMAVDFKYDQADLLYLCVLQMKPKEITGGTKDYKRLTIYQPLQTVVLEQLSDLEFEALKSNYPPKDQPFGPNVKSGDLVMFGNDVYQAIIPKPHKHEKTPAARVGYIDNPIDNGATKLSIFHAALPYAKKLLKINREIDLTTALVAHPIPFRFRDACEAIGCNGGTMTDGSTCSSCEGTGFKARPTTVAEELEFIMPDVDEGMLDPQKMMGYIHFPPEAAAFLVSQFDRNMEAAPKAVFNSELTTKSETAQTARFHSRAEQGVNDALWPYSKHISSVCEYLSICIAELTGNTGGVGRPIIPANLRFENLFDLFDELTAAREAGAGNSATAEIQKRIMAVQLKDNPEALKRWYIDDYFDPFRGMTEAQVLTAINSAFVPENDKIFYINRSNIMSDILQETPNFYSLDTKIQREKILAKVTAIKLGMMGIGTSEKDVLGKVPLALQQLALARERAREAGDMELAQSIGVKMDELLAEI